MRRAEPDNEEDYEAGRAVRGLLRRYERACRRVGRPVTVTLDPDRGSGTQWKTYRPFEGDVALIADVERCLGQLNEFQRKALALVALRGLSETVTAKRLHCNQTQVSRAYWHAIRRMHALLLAAKYVTKIPEVTSGEQESQKAGAKASVAQVVSREVCATRERAGASRV